MQNLLVSSTFPGSPWIAGTAAAPGQLTGAFALGGTRLPHLGVQRPASNRAPANEDQSCPSLAEKAIALA